MRFKTKNSKDGSKINVINRGGIRILPDVNGVFDTEMYQDSISVNTGSPVFTDTRYFTTISEEQVASAKVEIEELVKYLESEGLAEILDKPKAVKSEKTEAK